ncbi:uncharacterized protein LOC143553238 [Bidens hawaiensis]|uniref:uncharacterized protein LOC143553238 n=1 Tax=Bidens hawaiensis TaxID=980011 RepID=UPI004049664F
MADDALHTHQLLNCDDQRHYVLQELELLQRTAPIPVTLSKYGIPLPLPLPDARSLQCLNNRLLLEEKNRLNSNHSEKAYHVLAFIYGHGGTSKTFLWNTIISGLRSEGKVVLAVVASGIASLLLPGGRTAHSRFKIPFDLYDESTCSVSKNTHLAQLLTEASVIIWDEAPMNDRQCFESLDRSMKDILNNEQCPFGGKFVLLGGDFRQTLPIIPKASKTTIISSSLPRSYLWNKFVLFKLTENMCLQRPSLTSQEKEDIANFSASLLAIGGGTISTPDIDIEDGNDKKDN